MRDKIAFLGSGKMAEAIISGLIKSKSILPADVFVSDVDPKRLDHLKENYNVSVCSSNQDAVDKSDVLILSVKPQNFKDVLEGLNYSSIKLVVSIAAGITIKYLESKFIDKPVIRVMPNNPALVKKGITAIASGTNASEEDIDAVESIFKTVGSIVQVNESNMDAVTGLSGSGPAFLYLFIEKMVEAGEALGLTKSIAEELAIHTVLGSAETLLQTGKSPKELREMVTSPGGTTKAGLEVLEEKGFGQALFDAIIAASKRSEELSKSA